MSAKRDPAVRNQRLLQWASFTSTFDRFATAPMLVTMAADLRVSLAEISAAATLYYLLYGLAQPVWGAASDRLGRVKVMRFTLLSAGVAGGLSALAPTVPILVALRGLTGGLMSAVIPAALVYIGDTVAMERRQRSLADIMGATALGIAIASALAGVAAAAIDWRAGFALPAAAALALAVVLRKLPEPAQTGAAGSSGVGVLRRLRDVLRRPWALVVVIAALIEGGLVLGLLTFFPAALEASGFAPTVAGAATACFGGGVLLWTRAVKRLAGRLSAGTLMTIGGALLAAGFGLGARYQGPAGIAVGALIVGGGYAFLHTTLQAWATEVAADARAATISLFAGAVFIGSGLATWVAAPLAEAGAFTLLFGTAAALALPLGAGAGVLRERWGAASAAASRLEGAPEPVGDR